MNRIYSEENVNYKNKLAEITLSGTLTLPEAIEKNPVVILIAGYGPHDRDVTFAGKKSFKIIAENSSKKGIAVLRYDKRGIGQSTGNYSIATSRDFADDVNAGIEYLKSRVDIDTQRIGLIGLSEGGFIASMVAAESSDVAFVVLLAAAVLSTVDDFIEMNELQMLADGASKEFVAHDAQMRKQIFTLVKQGLDSVVTESKLNQIVTHYLAQLSETEKNEAEKIPFAFTPMKTDMMIKTFNSVWYRYFLSCNASEFLKKIKVPVLALNGDLDWIAFPDKTFPIMEKAFKEGNVRDYTFIKVPYINHMFQVCKSGSMAEYSTIKEEISPIVLDAVSNWLWLRIK